MKFLALLFVVGFACVLQQAFALPVEQHSDDDDVQTDLGKRLQEKLEELLQKLKERFEKGKDFGEDVVDKLKDVLEKMKEHKVEFGKKAKELLEKMKEKAREFLEKLKERLGMKGVQLVEGHHVAHLDFNLKDVFQKLKKALLDKIGQDQLKEMVEKLFGKGSEMADAIRQMLKDHGEKGKQKIMDFIDRILGEKEASRKRSIADLWEKVKDYFKNLHIDIKEKYLKFGQWVKENASKLLDHSKSKLDNIKAIAKEFVEHAKTLGKDVAAEAVEFLRPYKDDLGALWEQVKDAAKETMNRKDD